jgi:hypothetical protein
MTFTNQHRNPGEFTVIQLARMVIELTGSGRH